jgi:hypothetical protein
MKVSGYKGGRKAMMVGGIGLFWFKNNYQKIRGIFGENTRWSL